MKLPSFRGFCQPRRRFSPLTNCLEQQPLEDERMYATLPHQQGGLLNVNSAAELETNCLENKNAAWIHLSDHFAHKLSLSLCISYRDKHVLLFVYQYKFVS